MSDAKKKQPQGASCDNCQYCDWDEEWGDYVCMMDLDEDELIRVMGEGGAAACPYYRAYDEYKMVRKQN